jgi:hypothetical protein
VYELAKVTGQRALEHETVATNRMYKAQQASVKGLPRKCGNSGVRCATSDDSTSGARAVNPITDEWVSSMGEVNPYLMRSSG